MQTPEMQLLEPNQCINCHSISNSPYCKICGQGMKVQRITFATLSNDLQERVLGLDGRFSRTFFDTILTPGKVSRQFIAGNRRKYLSPVGYFFIILTVYLLIMGFENLNPLDLSRQGIELGSDQNTSNESDVIKKEFFEEFGNLFNDYFRIISFITVFLSGFLVWLFNRKRGYNLTEIMVFAFYTEAVVYIFSILSLPAINSEHQWFIFLSSAVSYIFFIYAYVDFFPHKSKVVGIIKAFAIRFLVFLLIAIIVAAVMLGYLITNKAI